MVHALGLQSPLSADLLVFSFVQWLCDFEDESKIRDKDIECAFWYKNLGYFLASYFRKYYHVEMQGLFLYICEGLASKHSIIKPELFILRELIEKMTGIMQIQDLNP